MRTGQWDTLETAAVQYIRRPQHRVYGSTCRERDIATDASCLQRPDRVPPALLPIGVRLLHPFSAPCSMPPRKAKPAAVPKARTQKKLDSFFPSSPTRSTSAAQQSSPARSTRTRKRRRIQQDSSEEDNAPGPSRIPEEDEGSQSSDAGAIRFEPPQVVEITSSEDDQDVAPRPSKANKGKKRIRRAHSDDSASHSGSQAEADEVYVRQGKRAVKKKVVAIFDSDEEEEERPRRRKLVKGERPSSPVLQDSDLLDEVDEESMSDSACLRDVRLTTLHKESSSPVCVHETSALLSRRIWRN